MQTKIAVVLTFLLILCGCSSFRHEVVRVGVDPSWAPYYFGAQNANVNGFIDDFLLLLASEYGMRFEKISANPTSLLEGLQQGSYDAVLASTPPYTYNMAKYDFSHPFFLLGPVLILPKNAPNRAFGKQQSIGVVAGEESDALFQKYPSLKVFSYLSATDLLNAVADQQCEGALLPVLIAGSYVDGGLYADQLKIVSKPLDGQGLRLLTLKGQHSDLIDRFNRHVSSLEERGKVTFLLNKWNLYNN